MDGHGWLHVVGEVENGSGLTIYLVRVVANFFNSSGGLVDTHSGYVQLRNTRPGQINCFDITMFTPPTDWSYYELERPSFYASNDLEPTLTIFNDSGSFDPTTRTYAVLGQVRNDGATRVDSVQVVSTLFDDNNTVIGCIPTNVNSGDLDPGQTSSFRVSGYGDHYSNVARYHVVTDGRPQ